MPKKDKTLIDRNSQEGLSTSSLTWALPGRRMAGQGARGQRPAAHLCGVGVPAGSQKEITIKLSKIQLDSKLQG